MNLKLRTVVVFLALVSAPLSDAQMKKLSEAQAVALAEKFIAQNGYTDLPPEKDKIVNESLELVPKVDEMLRRRHNSLKREAYGVSRGRKNGAPGWTVVFQVAGDDGKGRLGRAVTMNSDGRKMRVEHVPFILRRVDKRL